MFSLQKINPLSVKEKNNFDELVKSCFGATIFHEIKFLDYHKKKFEFEHFLIRKSNENIGSFTIVKTKEVVTNSTIINSPMGATYGGFLFKLKLNFSDSHSIVELIIHEFKKIDASKLEIVFPLDEYYFKNNNRYIKLAMINLGFILNPIEASSILELDCSDVTKKFSSRVKRSIKKAQKNEIKIQYDAALTEFFGVYDKTYLRHGNYPTHSKEDLIYLTKCYPERISINLAYFQGKVVSGICVFNLNCFVDILFYICSDIEYNFTQANSLLIYQTAIASQAKGIKYLDFGTCTEGLIVRENILKFKEGFGCQPSFREKLSYQYKL